MLGIKNHESMVTGIREVTRRRCIKALRLSRADPGKSSPREAKVPAWMAGTLGLEGIIRTGIFL